MKTIQVSPADVSLMHVAAREWGDATAWLALAIANQKDLRDANGLADPMIYGLGTLTIPAWNPAYSGSAPA